MVDIPGLAVAAPFLGLFGLFLSLRLAYIQGAVRSLRNRKQVVADRALANLQRHLRQRGQPDTTRTANLASEYCSQTQKVTELRTFDSQNWREIGLDIIGIILCLAYSFYVPPSPSPEWSSLGTVLLSALLLIFAFSMYNFVDSIMEIRRVERRLDDEESNNRQISDESRT
jgi:hypothetical protein